MPTKPLKETPMTLSARADIENRLLCLDFSADPREVIRLTKESSMKLGFAIIQIAMKLYEEPEFKIASKDGGH